MCVQVIRAVQPDVVVVELCKSRINILELDEAKLLEEAKNINLEKFRLAIKQVLNLYYVRIWLLCVYLFWAMYAMQNKDSNNY